MPVMDEFKEERAALRQASLKDKISYFLDYYKWHTVAVIAAGILIVSLIYQVITRKDNAIYVAMLNTVELETAGEYVQRYAEYAGIDTGKYDVLIDTSMHIDISDTSKINETTMMTSQKLLTYLAAGEIDVIISDESTLTSYAYNGTFIDLRDILTETQIASYEPYFYYMDKAYADELHSQIATLENYNASPEYPYSRTPDKMADPIPVGLYLDAANELKENYYFPYEDMVLGVPGNTKNLEAISSYIDFVLQKTPQ